jgi:uncharacterized protein YdhG (YjbR/CyaY superfamily)
MTTIATVNEYIVAQQPEARARLLELRTTVRAAAVPQATEVMSYGMPTYRAQRTARAFRCRKAALCAVRGRN